MSDEQKEQPTDELPSWLADWHKMHDEISVRRSAKPAESAEELPVQKTDSPPEPAEPEPKAAAETSADLQARLHEAAARHDWSGAKALLDRDVVPLPKTLALAVEKASSGWEGWAQQLIDAGAKPTPEMLHNVTVRSDWKTAEVLIRAKVVPLPKTLALAVERASSGWEGWAQQLIDAGAKPTPDMLHNLTVRCDWKTANVLIKANVVPLPKTLSFAVERSSSGWEGWAQQLIDAGAEPTPDMLHNLTVRCDWKTADVLIRAKVVPLPKTLSFAVERASSGWKGWAQQLIDAGAKPTSDMLHNATVRCDWKTAKVLIDGGAAPLPKTLSFVAQRAASGWGGWENAMAEAVKERERKSVKNSAKPSTPKF